MQTVKMRAKANDPELWAATQNEAHWEDWEGEKYCAASIEM